MKYAMDDERTELVYPRLGNKGLWVFIGAGVAAAAIALRLISFSETPNPSGNSSHADTHSIDKHVDEESLNDPFLSSLTDSRLHDKSVTALTSPASSPTLISTKKDLTSEGIPEAGGTEPVFTFYKALSEPEKVSMPTPTETDPGENNTHAADEKSRSENESIEIAENTSITKAPALQTITAPEAKKQPVTEAPVTEPSAPQKAEKPTSSIAQATEPAEPTEKPIETITPTGLSAPSSAAAPPLKTITATPKPKAPPTSQPKQFVESASQSKRYFLQAGAFKTQLQADRQRAELLLDGYSATVKAVTLNSGDKWHRVLLGPYPIKEAKVMQQKLKAQSIQSHLRAAPKQ